MYPVKRTRMPFGYALPAYARCLLALIYLSTVSSLAVAGTLETRIYTAKAIITMDAELPLARAVAVRDGRILAVGSLESVREALGNSPYRVDGQFDEMVIVPGFIDSHIHTIHSAMLLPMITLTPANPGKLHKPAGETAAGDNSLFKQLQGLAKINSQSSEWLDMWGYQPDLDGLVSRTGLDRVSAERPVLLWHKYLDAIHMNTAAIKSLGLETTNPDSPPTEDLQSGEVRINSIEQIRPLFIRRLLEKKRHVDGLRRAREMIRNAGITTVSDAAFASLGYDQEFRALIDADFDSKSTPFRTVLMINGSVVGDHMTHVVTEEWIRSLPARSTHRLQLRGDAVMLELDGPPFFPTLRNRNPGQNTAGAWVMDTNTFGAAAATYWRSGFQVNVQANSADAIELTLTVFHNLQSEFPREGITFIMHGACDINTGQMKRVTSLGGRLAAGLSCDMETDGSARREAFKRDFSPAGAGSPIALYSDFPFGPLPPLERVQAALGAAGLHDPAQVDKALWAVTLEPATQLGLESEIGSIAEGKSADFTLLGGNPYTVEPAEIGNIEVLGVVFEGTAHLL